MGAPVNFDDLRMAYEWSSAAEPGSDNEAYVSRETGKIYWATDSGDVEEELPEDIYDESLYVRVPRKHDLDLGRDLVFEFVRENLPGEYERVRDFFGRRGAYGRFKHLLEDKGRLEAWYTYEEQAVDDALREWAVDNELELSDVPRADG